MNKNSRAYGCGQTYQNVLGASRNLSLELDCSVNTDTLTQGELLVDYLILEP